MANVTAELLQVRSSLLREVNELRNSLRQQQAISRSDRRRFAQLELRAEIAEARCRMVADYCDQVEADAGAPPFPVPPPFWVVKLRTLIGMSS